MRRGFTLLLVNQRLHLSITDSPAGLPLSKRISEALLREIHRGRFVPGQKLPSSRALARALDVHRNTVLSAYEELTEQGYITTAQGRATYVSPHLPADRSKSTRGRARRATKSCTPPLRVRLSPPSPEPSYRPLAKGVIALLGGLPDLREAPLPALARAYRAALTREPACLDYQSHFGNARLLVQLEKYLAEERGVLGKPGELLVTRGSQQALFLAARALVRPGAVIAVERAGYTPAWEGLRLAGAELIPVRVDRHGLVTDELARLCRVRDVCGVYVTPHHQYPTTVTMSAARRMQLLALAKEHRFMIVEDDYDHEYHFSQHPVLPLASTDHQGTVLYIGTLSKIFAPGLRIGYAVGQPDVISHMATTRTYIDRQGDHATELALSYLMEDGEFGAHVRRMHRKYESRREVFFYALETELSSELSFRRPPGGLAIWARVLGQIAPEEWAARAEDRGVLVQPGRQFFFDKKPRPYLRLGFARHNEKEIELGVKRLARALRNARGFPVQG